MLKFLDSLLRSLGERLDAAVIQVPHIAADLMTCSRALCKIAKPDTLHFAGDHKFACDRHGY